jgi:AAA domain/DnaB-like helicase N terminal domain
MTDNLSLPRNKEIEKAVLGALLLSESPERVKEIRETLPPDAFMAQAREIYECLCEMADRGDSINPLMLWTRLKERNSTVEGATVAMLTDDAPIRSDLSSEIAELKKLSTLRAIQHYANYLTVESQARDADVPALLEGIKTRTADFDEMAAADDSGAFPTSPGFYSSLRELHAKETVPAEDLMIGVRRRQVTIFASVTSVGKTTIMLNHALAAAGGQSWSPLLPERPERPLKIVFIDAESTDDELKRDTQTMLRTIGNGDLAAENFIPVVDATIDGEMLNLSTKKHFDHVKRFLKYHQPDIAIFDTISALFTLYSENDNAEVVRKVIRPLKELAVAGNCAVWASHHIGKAGESDEAEEAYRGRGASAFGANVRGVITLRKEKALGDGYVRLTLGKSKGSKLEPVNLKLDFARRAFELCAAAPQAQTPYQQVIGVFNGKPLKTGEVKKLLSDLSRASVERALAEAVKNGDLFRTTYGAYERPNDPQNTDSLNSLTPYRDEGVEGVAQTEDSEDVRGFFEEVSENGMRDFSEPLDDDPILDAIDQ